MEMFDIYDFSRIKTGESMTSGTPVPNGFYRIVVRICVFNSNGEMLIQQRQPFMDGWCGLWDISCGGSAISGETSQQAAERELFEELGISVSFKNTAPSLTASHPTKGYFDDVYIVNKDIELSQLNFQYEEVKTAKWASCSEILQMIENNTFIPYNPNYINLLFWMRNHNGFRTRKDWTQKIKP